MIDDTVTLRATTSGNETALTTGETAGTDVVPGNTDSNFALAMGDTATGFINTASDSDWYAVQLTAGQTYSFSETATSGGLDSYLELYTEFGLLLASDDDSGPGTDSNLVFLATETATYYIAAKDFRGDGQSSTGGYSLSYTTTTKPQPLDSIDWGSKVDTNTVLVYFVPAGQTAAGTSSLGWNSYEKQQAMLALQQYSNVANITFQETNNANVATFRLVTTTSQDFLGEFGPPGTGASAGVGDFARNGDGWDEAGGGGLEMGGLGFAVLLHEFGHGLGMAHPHDDGGSSQVMQRVTAEFSSYGLYGLNEGVYTVMSYNDGWALQPGGRSTTNTYGNQATPMALDVALMQEKYGANTSFATGDNTYSLTSSITSAKFVCIWDAGGTDTIAFSGSAACYINLTAATLDYSPTGGGVVSYVTGVSGGFTIANGVVIERAAGGSGDDTLVGNAGNNILTGNAGDDTLDGGGGYDIATFNAASTSASYVHNYDGSWLVFAGADGTDAISRVDLLRFTDRDVSLNAQGPNTADFNLDLRSDIVFRHDSGELYLWNSQTGATVSFSGHTLGQVSNVWALQGDSDYNGDGKGDLLFRHDNGEVYVQASSGNAGALVGQSLGFVPLDWDIASAAGDFNGDGKADILWRNDSGEVYLWASQMNGNLQYAGQSLGFTPNSWAIQGVGDFNGDGKSDILWRHDGGEVYVQTSDPHGGTVALTGQTLGFVGNDWAIQGIGDFNGDGKSDILWRNDGGDVYVWNANAGSAVGFTGQSISHVPLDWDIFAIGDYNGDGRADILWRNDNGDVYVWNSNTGPDVSFLGQDIGIVDNAWDIEAAHHWI